MKLTAPRLVAALFLAAVGYGVSELVKPLMVEGTQFGIFNFVNAGLGLIIGWVVIGSRIGRGMAAAISYGFTAAIVLLFWALFVQAVNEMLRLALRRRFDDPVEAITATFTIGFDFAQTIATPAVLGSVLVGGILAAVLAEISAKHWS